MEKKYAEIEIETAKNLIAAGYEWIARDKDDDVYAYCARPVKGGTAWWQGGGGLLLMNGKARGVIPIFDGISWSDSEPVRLHDIIPQILTDKEKSYIRTIIAPFRDRVKSVMVRYGNLYGKLIRFIAYVPDEYQDECGEVDTYFMPVAEDDFLGMKEFREYTLEELEV